MKKESLLKRMFSGWGEKRSYTGEEIPLNDQRLLELLGIDIGEINVKGKNALKVATVYTCIRILSEAVAKLPLKVYREDEEFIQKATKHPVYSLLKLRPNPYMSAFDFWKCIDAQSSIHGNAYANIEFDRMTGSVKALWPIDATKVRVMVDNIGELDGLIDQSSKIWYEVTVNGEKRKVMPHSMLHFKNGITLDGIIGISPIDYLKSTVENASSAEKFINNFFKQGLQVKGLIQYVGDMNNDAKKEFIKEFESMSSGLKNSHRVALMPFGYQFTPMSLNMNDAQFLENNELTIRQIAAAYGIKMHQLNDLSSSTHSNIEQQQLQFYTDTMQARLTNYEQEMTYKLFLEDELESGLYTRFNVDSILRADIKTRYEAYRIGIEAGFIAPNEARAKEDWEPKEGGDQLTVNGNRIPVTMVGQQYLKGGGNNEQGTDNAQGNEGEPSTSGQD